MKSRLEVLESAEVKMLIDLGAITESQNELDAFMALGMVMRDQLVVDRCRAILENPDKPFRRYGRLIKAVAEMTPREKADLCARILTKMKKDVDHSKQPANAPRPN